MIHYIGASGNNIAKFIDCQILADTLILKLIKNVSAMLPIDILLMVK